MISIATPALTSLRDILPDELDAGAAPNATLDYFPPNDPAGSTACRRSIAGLATRFEANPFGHSYSGLATQRGPDQAAFDGIALYTGRCQRRRTAPR